VNTTVSWRCLPALSQLVDADPRLVHQFLGAVVTRQDGRLGGHRFHRVERPGPGDAVVRFEVALLGRDLSTVERVSLDDRGLGFVQVTGYLEAVEERIDVTPVGDCTRLSYSGRYQPRQTLAGRLLGPLLVPMIYRRELRATLRSIKLLAEQRQAGSAMFRRA